MSRNTSPRLRFGGFAGEWEERKIIDVADYVDYRGKTPKKTEDGIFLITAKNVKMGCLDYEISQEFIAIDDFENVMSRGKAKIGDVLITTEAPLGNVAQIDREDVALAQRIIKYRGIKGILNNDFLVQRFLSDKFQAALNALASGGTVQGIKGSLLHQMEISLPSELEQTALGDFFRRLDETLAQARARLAKTQQLKRAMLAKLFPAQGETAPKLRFQGFSGDWERKMLGGVVEIVMGQSPSSTSYTENPNDFILVQGNADMKDGKVFPRVWTTELTKQGKAGDIVMSVRAPVGDVGKTDYDIVLGRGVCAIKGNEFIYQALWKMKSDGYWNSVSSGSTFESVNSDDIKNAELLIPSKEEQTAIGNFFQKLDQTLALQTAALEKLTNLKKALLAAMLV